MPEHKKVPLPDIMDSILHPFYAIGVDTYQIEWANKACGFGGIKENMTCHMSTHKSPNPCTKEHICPLEEVKKTHQGVITEHVHSDKDGQSRIMEVHGDPIFDEKGNLVMMLEYAFDVTERRRAEEALKARLQELERIYKIIIGREKRVIELKNEIDDLLKSLGRLSKYNI